jgi:rod shape-determining protein MreC
MQNLLEFLSRNGVFLVFIGLEVLCFNLVIRNNQRQSEIYHETTMAFTASMQKRVSSITDYWALGSVNDSLRMENARLREDLLNNKTATISPGSAGREPFERFQTIPANVIQNSVGLRNNYITLDKGVGSGIKPGMGVISLHGPVGIVVAATRGFSKVMSLLHSNSSVSASLKSKGHFGSLKWRTADPRIMELEAIPKHAQLMVGDTVVTSGYSRIFPPDIMIGIVDTFWLPRGSNFYRARVKLSNDMGSLHSAYIISDLSKPELDSLANIDINE